MYKLTFAFLSLLFLASCTKQTIQEICIDDVCIDGEWTWVESYGSIAGLTITPETENETRTLVITDNSYKEYHGSDLIVDTDYEFVKSDELPEFTNDSLILKLGTGNWLAVFKVNDNLKLVEPCFDCWDHTYELE